MEYIERNLYKYLPKGSVEDVAIFNCDPKPEDFKEAFESNKILFCNCSSRDDTEKFRMIENNIKEEWQHSFVMCYWYTISNEDFEELISKRLESEERNRLKWEKIMWKAPKGYNKYIKEHFKKLKENFEGERNRSE